MCSIDWNLLLEYLKVLLTIPTLASLTLIIFIYTFKAELKNLINRIASIKFPGGTELWEYRYLNYFLVRKTQLVLDWLTNFNQPVTANLYDSVWIPSIHNANERQIILNVLQAHHLIQIDQLGLIGLTAKGREYIEWRGALPGLTT